jgi:calpain-15
LLIRLLEVNEYNSQGCYCIWFCIDGKWTPTIIDDFFPCRNEFPVFAQSQNEEIWVLIFEKAYAKAFGNPII